MKPHGMHEAQRRAVRTYCDLCSVYCPAVVTIESERIVSFEPDTSHPLGGALCAKGRAAPEMHAHPDRVDRPLRRTRPKTDPDPGWEACSWDEALEVTARAMLDARERHGPHAVAFSKGAGSGAGFKEADPWIQRLANVFGSPNMLTTAHLCWWPRDIGAAYYTYGTDGLPRPDVERSDCIVLWGTNPNATQLDLAQRVAAARARGAELIVIDPRRIGLANKAGMHLQVRPGTDGALALSMIDVLLSERLYDERFVRRWTNAPLLVRADTGRLLRATDVDPNEATMTGFDDPNTIEASFVALDSADRLVLYDAGRGEYACEEELLQLEGTRAVRIRAGATVSCHTALAGLKRLAADHASQLAAGVTGVPAEQIVAAARTLAARRPTSVYFYNGVIQHTNATQTCRAIAVLLALVGDLGRPGGNVVGPRLIVHDIVGAIAARDALPAESARLRLGRADRPLGPAERPGVVTAYDLYRAILERRPYPVAALLSFGHNILLANGDTEQGRRALECLEFFAAVELFHTPTTRYADVVLPATTFLEDEALNAGFLNGLAGIVQRRPKLVATAHERRPDIEIIFDLACRLGLAHAFWNGDVEAAYDAALAPTGLTWAALADHPHGVDLRPAPSAGPPDYESVGANGRPRGFATGTRKVELFSDTFAEHGMSGLPAFEEPALSPRRTPDVAQAFPLVLTNAKRPQYLHSQGRGLPHLRRLAPEPRAEIHPATAARYGVAQGDWIDLETPDGRTRLRADVTDRILEDVVCADAGWWQACDELGLPGFDPFSADGANLNLLVRNELRDPISGSTPHRSMLCRISRASAPVERAGGPEPAVSAPRSP